MKPPKRTPQRPYLPPSLEAGGGKRVSGFWMARPVNVPVAPLASIHFLVHTGMQEIQELATTNGWYERGCANLIVSWTEVYWTTDAWQKTHVTRSTDVPCPMVNGYIFLPEVAPNTEVEFALRVGISARAAHDTCLERAAGEVWLNNHGTNYKQKTV